LSEGSVLTFVGENTEPKPILDAETDPVFVADDLAFDRATAHALYKAGFMETHPHRWLRISEEVRFEDVVLLLTGLTGLKISCPFHGRDSNPSFQIYRRGNDAFCFGCLDENELIWTDTGLKPIREVEINAQVLGQTGKWETVWHKEVKQGALLAVGTDNFRRDPLLLTPDHTCIYVRRDDALRFLPYLQPKPSAKTGMVFWGSYKKNRKMRERSRQTPITEGPAEDLKSGDYLLFPVISPADRNVLPLDNQTFLPRYKKGMRPAPVPVLPVEHELCRLYGLYLAEGSVGPTRHPRTVRWTFHLNEAKSLGVFVQRVLSERFGLAASLFEYQEHTTCEVICSSVDLARSLAFWFGQGSNSKRLPAQALSWPVAYQKSLIEGYLDGDGDDRNRGTTVSRQLAYSLFALGIQAGVFPSLGYTSPHVDKKGLSHAEKWSVAFLQRESVKGFFQEIDGNHYYWSRVSDVSQATTNGRVVDLTVTGTESFTTKLGVVHNCPPGEQYYDAVTFTAKRLGVSKLAALQYLEKQFGLPPIDDIEIADLEEERDGGYVELKFPDLKRAYIEHAAKDVQTAKDVELAIEYIEILFDCWPSRAEEKADPQAGDPLPLARVLGKTTLDFILARKKRGK
jgi:hypothetical protein